MTETPTHDQAGHDAITAELVRLTLGHRGPQRWELDVEFLKATEQMRRDIAAMQAQIGRALLPSLRALARLVADIADRFGGDR